MRMAGEKQRCITVGAHYKHEEPATEMNNTSWPRKDTKPMCNICQNTPLAQRRVSDKFFPDF